MQTVKNYEGTYNGPTRLRNVLIKSLNASADRVIRDIGASTVANYVERFGFNPERRERNASLALGSLAVTPLEMAAAYTVLANGGYAVGIANPDDGKVRPYFIERVENAVGEVLYDASLSVRRVCPDLEDEDLLARLNDERLIAYQGEVFPRLRCAEQVESPQRIFLITDVLKGVIQSGSGRRARDAFPGRLDLAGKTGTTTGPRDAWFAGFNADLVAIARVGFDEDARDLGAGEQGGRTAIPAWIDYMRVMIDGQPEHALPRPPGIDERRINPETGLLAADCARNTIWEYFEVGRLPEKESSAACFTGNTGSGSESSGGPGSGSGSDSLFE
jgi:penicillin-binding protein 1A